MNDTRKRGITVFEFVAGFIGMLAIAGIILLGAGLGTLLGLPYVVTGLIVGVLTTWAIVAGSFAGSKEVQCIECGNREKVAENVASHRCSNCGHVMAIKNKEQEVTLYSAFPTD